jgi:hypothetical protein
MVKLRLHFLSLLVLLALVLQASAYTAQYADKAKTLRLRWKNSTINLEISRSVLKQLPLVTTSEPDGIYTAIERGLQHWKDIAGVNFNVTLTDKTDVSPAGLRGDGASLITIADTPDNILFFDGEPETAAKTRIFFNGKGQITEGDIVLNPYQLFSDNDTNGTFDLESVLTHEIGHLLGLGHSEITGATMQGHHAKNGIYGLPVAAFRSLSEDDIAGIRALYGAQPDDLVECCGTVNGKLNLGREKLVKGLQVWLEDSATGRIMAGTSTDPGGLWSIEGLSAGKYNVFAQSDPDQGQAKIKKFYSAEKLGEINIENGKTAQFEKTLTLKPRKMTLDYLGFGAQLSTLAVPVNNGKTYALFLADKTLPADLSVSFNSPSLSVIKNSLRPMPFDDDVKAYLVDVSVAENTLPGEYSLRLQNKLGEVIYLVGALTVDPAVANNNVSYFSIMNR